MPPNKKAQQNAFYYYMIHLMDELKKSGYNFPNGLADVVPIAGPKWKKLSSYEKAPYEEQARKAKNKKNVNCSTKDTRLDCTGMLISERLEPLDELSKRYQEQEHVITNKWGFQPESELLKTKFCFINFQTMCKTLNDEYLPLEVAVIEYTMNDGITKEFHQFINAGEIPVGYRYEAQLHSDSTHKIPIENFDLAQSNYHELWLKLTAFAEGAEFFCLSKDFKEMEFCLNWIRRQSGIDMDPIKLYALEKLVMDLFKFARHPVAKYQILDMLTTTAFDYEPHTRCTWHEEKGIIHCSLAIIRRFAYAMSDSLTNVYDFKLTAHHLPVKDQKIKGVTINPTHFSSKKKSNRFRQNIQRSSAPSTQTVISSDSSDDDKSEPELEALRMPESKSLVLPSWGEHAEKESYFRSETNFPSLGRGSARPEQTIRQSSVPTTIASCWQRPPQDILTSVNARPSEAPHSKPQQSTSLAAATLNAIPQNSNNIPPFPAGVWSRSQKDQMSDVAPSLENFPTLSSVIADDKLRKSNRGPQGSSAGAAFGGHDNAAPLCFAAMAGRGRGRGIRPVVINLCCFKVLALLLSLSHSVGIQELIPVLTLLEELQEVSFPPTLMKVVGQMKHLK